MMAFKWVLSFTHVLGHTENLKVLNKDTELKAANKYRVKMMKQEEYPNGFEMPLHYPRYKKSDYEKMEEWKLDLLLKQYGLSFQGTLDEKRAFAMGAFLWPDQF